MCYGNNSIEVSLEVTKDIWAQNGALLANQSYQVIFESCSTESVVNNNVTSKVISYIITTVTLLSSFVGMNSSGPSLVWTLIGALQLVSYLSFMNINYPYLLRQYLLAYNFLIIPNFFGYSESNTSNSNDFLITTGRDLSLFIIITFIFFLLKILKRLTKGRILIMVKKSIEMMK